MKKEIRNVIEEQVVESPQNIFINPVAREEFIQKAAYRIHHDIFEAHEKIGDLNSITFEHIEKSVEDIADEIVDAFGDMDCCE